MLNKVTRVSLFAKYVVLWKIRVYLIVLIEKLKRFPRSFAKYIFWSRAVLLFFQNLSLLDLTLFVDSVLGA